MPLLENVYNPDILNCLANLSNDEVFTPPEMVNRMLDMLPQELFRDRYATFLDPACKTGVFLREIAKRLLEGLKDVIPDEEERRNHIFTNQLYGIAITEMTAMLSRRSLYCSKFANGRYSIVPFDKPEGNIRFKNLSHYWLGERCGFCGASKSEYDRAKDLEQHAYEFIHTVKPEEIWKMNFDVIIGNPPYQMSFGIEGGNKSNAKSIYNLFIEQAIKLNPRFLVMITPSRWMTKTAQGISNDWVDAMIHSNKFSVIHDYEDSSDCFPGVVIMGGVNYFLWERDYSGKCEYHFHTHDKVEIVRNDYLDVNDNGIVIRDPQSFSILLKISKVEGQDYTKEEKSFASLVSPKHFFDDSTLLTSNWSGYSQEKNNRSYIKYYLNKSTHNVNYAWINKEQIPKNFETSKLHKVFIPTACGSMEQVLGKPFYGEPDSVCSQTYLVIGYDAKKHKFTKEQCLNIIKYISTRFFRYLVSIKKKTQNGPRGVYQFVPVQDFSTLWTDAELFKKYRLTEDEIRFIEAMIKPMELEVIGDA